MIDIKQKVDEFDRDHKVMRIILIGEDEAIRQIILEDGE